MWVRTFLALVILNTMLLGVSQSVAVQRSSVAGAILLWPAAVMNYPGILSSFAIGVGDELDERFGVLWSGIITWGFSLPWLALAAAVLTEVRVESQWRRRKTGWSGRGLFSCEALNRDESE